MPTVTQDIATRTSAMTFDTLPADAVSMAKRCILDLLGVQVFGATLRQIQPALELARQMGGPGDSQVVLHGDRMSPSAAAYVNAAFGHSCEFDDSHVLGGHIGACVIPVAFALAETDNRTDGEQLLASIVAGYEAMVLSCGVIHRATLTLGWHGMKVAGVFGAAATASNLMGLTPATTTNAFGIAASDCSGTMEYDQGGGEVKRLHAALPARAGLEAAFLAQLGMTGPSTILEGRRGIWALFGDGSPIDRHQHWDRRFHILDTMFKMYPSMSVIHAPLDALRTIQSRHPFEISEVREIRVGVVEWAVAHLGTVYAPVDSISAQFSLPFSIALHLVRQSSDDIGSFYDPKAWLNETLLGVARKVTVDPCRFEAGAPEFGAHVEVVLTDGTRHEHYQRAPRGHSENPASREDVLEKYYKLTTPILGRAGAERAADAIEALDAGATAGDVLSAVRWNGTIRVR